MFSIATLNLYFAFKDRRVQVFVGFLSALFVFAACATFAMTLVRCRGKHVESGRFHGTITTATNVTERVRVSLSLRRPLHLQCLRSLTVDIGPRTANNKQRSVQATKPVVVSGFNLCRLKHYIAMCYHSHKLCSTSQYADLKPVDVAEFHRFLKATVTC